MGETCVVSFRERRERERAKGGFARRCCNGSGEAIGGVHNGFSIPIVTRGVCEVLLLLVVESKSEQAL